MRKAREHGGERASIGYLLESVNQRGPVGAAVFAILAGWLAPALLAAPLTGRVPVALAKEGAQRKQGTQAKAPEFERDVLPIFKANCLRCHDSNVKKGGLDLSTLKGVVVGATSGPVVVPSDPDASRLYSMIHDGTMPLDRRTQVSAAEMETIRVWIKSWSDSQDLARP